MPEAKAQGHDTRCKLVNGREVAGKSEACPECNHSPGHPLQNFLGQPAGQAFLVIGPNTNMAISLDPPLHLHEDFGVDRLWACIAAEEPTGNRSEEEQPKGREQEQCREVNEVLWNQNEVEDVKAPGLEVEEDGGPSVPGDPRREVVERLCEEHEGPAPAIEKAIHSPGINLLAGRVEQNGLLYDGGRFTGSPWAGHGVVGLWERL